MTDQFRPLPAARAAALGFAIAVWIAACGGSGGSPGSPSSSPLVTSPQAAVAAVVARNPSFSSLTPKDPNMIGQCCFYQVTPNGVDFTVEIEVGWGDCPAGCIDRHHWSFTVTQAGVVILAREDGPPVPPGLPGAGGSSGSPGPIPTGGSGGPGTGIGIAGTATAGPVCPVSRPGDPNCADRPVAGATIHVVGADGSEVATLRTDAAGRFEVDLPAGNYQVIADAVKGLMVAPAPVPVTIATSVANVKLQYDTGIR